MTIDELIRDHELRGSQRAEVFAAYDEDADGFERVCRKASGANNPTAALIAMIKRGEHRATPTRGRKHGKPARDTLDDVTQIALRAYNARTAKYPSSVQIGFRSSDATWYGSWVAQTWNGRFSIPEIEASLLRLLAKLGRPIDQLDTDDSGA